MKNIFKWEKIKQGDTTNNKIRPVICKDCTKRIGKHYNESYYKIDGVNYCNECINKYKKDAKVRYE